MSKRKFTECDLCKSLIGSYTARYKVIKYGYWPCLLGDDVVSEWGKRRIDVCDRCMSAIVEAAKGSE